MVLTGDELGMMEDALVAYNDLGCVLFQVFIRHSFLLAKVHYSTSLFCSTQYIHPTFAQAFRGGGLRGLTLPSKIMRTFGGSTPFIEHILSWIRS